jgi:hypothetical protein
VDETLEFAIAWVGAPIPPLGKPCEGGNRGLQALARQFVPRPGGTSHVREPLVADFDIEIRLASDDREKLVRPREGLLLVFAGEHAVQIDRQGQATEMSVEREPTFLIGRRASSRAALLVQHRSGDPKDVGVKSRHRIHQASQLGEALGWQMGEAANAPVRCYGLVALDELSTWCAQIKGLTASEYLILP